MTENTSLPIFLVVDEDTSAVDILVSDLERRFAADYRVVGESSPAAALERLSALRDAGEQVALIICYEPMRAMSGSELLARSRSAHPDAPPRSFHLNGQHPLAPENPTHANWAGTRAGCRSGSNTRCRLPRVLDEVLAC